MKIRQLVILSLSLLASVTTFAQWKTQTLPPLKVGIYPPAPNGNDVMWLVTGNYGTDTSGIVKPIEFVRTVDGGKTFTSGKLFDDANAYSCDIRPLADGNTAFMVAAAAEDGYDNIIQKTVDGGKTWQKLPYVPDSYPDIIYFFNQQEGLYVGDADSLGLVLMYSSDGGNTFTRVPPSSLPPSTNEYSVQSEMTVIGNTFFMTTFDANNNNRIWRTTDKGHHWTASAYFETGDNFVARFSFADSLNGMVLRGIADNAHRPIYTHDGGATWNESASDLPGEAAYPIRNLPGTQTFIALLGDRTRNKLFTALTNDYGKTWNTFKDVAPYTLDSIYYPNNPPFDFSNLEISDNHHAWAKFNQFDLSRYNSTDPLVPEKPDLELTLVADNDQPSLYTYVKFTLTITNRGISKATGVKVNWLPPYNRTPGAGGSYAYTAAYASKGNYDSWHGIWTIDDLQPNETQTVSFHLYVLRTDVNVVQSAQVTACNEQDLDSTPNNMGATPKEDDEAQYVFKAAGAIAFPANASEKAAASYSVGPNPARDFVNVFYDSKELTEATIIITDVTGRVVQSENIGQAQAGSSRLNTSGLAAGIYVVSVVRKDDQTRLMTQRLSIVH